MPDSLEQVHRESYSGIQALLVLESWAAREKVDLKQAFRVDHHYRSVCCQRKRNCASFRIRFWKCISRAMVGERRLCTAVHSDNIVQRQARLAIRSLVQLKQKSALDGSA